MASRGLVWRERKQHTDAEVEAGVEAGVGRFVVDSFDELARIERAAAGRDGPVPTVLVRVTPGVEAHTHEFIETGTQASKFGFTVSEGVALDAIGRTVASSGVRFGGIHCHIGSQIERLDAYGRAIDVDPIENPYVYKDGTTTHPASRPYLDRSRHRRGMAYHGGVLVRAFAGVGWGWGGDWPRPTDYQHFSATGR